VEPCALARRTAQTRAIGIEDRCGQPEAARDELSSTTASRRVLRGTKRETLTGLPARELDRGPDVPEVGFLARQDREAQRQGLYRNAPRPRT
jgi:hypothetical protein